MDEGKLRLQEGRGQRAKALLENELLKESFEHLELSLMSAWRETSPDEHERREDAWRSLKLLNKLQEHLRRHVTTGQAAGKELLRIKDPTLLERITRNV